MAGVKTTGPVLEGNPPRLSAPPDSAPPITGKTGKPDAQSVPEVSQRGPAKDYLADCNLELFSPAKSKKWPRIDIIAVHGSREDVNSMWTWRKSGKDTTPKNPTGSAKPGGTPLGNPASKQGESGATVPEGNRASKQGETDATAPEGNRAPKQGGTDTTVPEGNRAPKQGETDATVPEGNRAPKQGETDATAPEGNRAPKQGGTNATVPEGSFAPKQGEAGATVSEGNRASKQGETDVTVPEGSSASKQGETDIKAPEGSSASKQGETDVTVPEGDASKSNLPAETVPQMNHKPREPDKKALDTSVPPEASVAQSDKAEKATPEAKGLQSNTSGEKGKRGLPFLKPLADLSKKLEPKSTKHESGGEPSKRESRFPFLKPPSKTESTEPITEDSHRNAEQSPQRELPATVGADPKSAPAKGTRKQSVANDQGGEPREPEKVNWLKDDKMLPRALPECRVLGFCYPTTFPASTPAQNVLESLAREFLKAIKKRWKDDARVEQQENESHRRRAPIIFIGHELGGLIIEKALSIADTPQDEKEKSLLSLTAAVIFLATPFSDSGSKEKVVNQLTSKVLDTLGAGLGLVRGSRRQILVHEVAHEVKYDSAGLRQLPDSFAGLVETNGIPVVCFNPKSPDSDQSKSKAEDTKFKSIELDKNTKEICKFPSRTDGDYVKVLTALREFVARRHMHDAVLEDDGVLMRLLEAGLDVELQDEFGRTPLQIAVMNRRLHTVRLLLGRGGANIAHRDKNGFTVLHHAVRAAKRGESDPDAKRLIKLLLEKGADVEMVDNDDKTAWELKDTQKWLVDLKIHRALVQGASKPVTVDLKMPQAPSKKEAITACQGFSATMMEFYYNGKEESYLMEKASIEELIYNPKSGPDDILILARPLNFEQTPSCRWYHIPANNETWVQDLFAKLGVRVDSMDEHRHEGYALHSRFMRPQVKKTEYWKQTTATGLAPNPKKPEETGKSDMMLYIPFLSFETSSSRKQMSEIVMQVQKKQNMYGFRKTYASKSDQSDDESLIKAYYESLHPRRTLDQFYYYMLENTETRDKSQVIQSWAERQHQSHGRPTLNMQESYVMMADQLWLWIINDNTVVTSFAEPWGESRERDSFDVLGRFIEHMKRKDRSPVKSGHDLAMKIVKHCLNAFNTCNPPGLKLHDVFESSINFAANKETNLFEHFRSASEKLTSPKATLDSDWRAGLRDSLFNISSETNQLKDVKHILDELNIVSTMLKEQKDVLSKMSKNFPHISCPESIVDNNIKHAEKMEEHAKNTYRALNHLLDLKQKQANGWEARFAREQSEQSARQGNVVLLFTIVIIIFLPLSFMSSFFALNIAQFPKDSTGTSTEWQLSTVSGYLFGVSFATSIPFILIAVNADTVKEVWTRWGRGRRGGVRWAGFRSRIPFFGRRIRKDHRSYIPDDSSSLVDWEDPHYSYMSSTTVWSQDQVRDGTTGFDPDALGSGVGLHWRGKEKISEVDEV